MNTLQIPRFDCLEILTSPTQRSQEIDQDFGGHAIHAACQTSLPLQHAFPSASPQPAKPQHRVERTYAFHATASTTFYSQLNTNVQNIISSFSETSNIASVTLRSMSYLVISASSLFILITLLRIQRNCCMVQITRKLV